MTIDSDFEKFKPKIDELEKEIRKIITDFNNKYNCTILIKNVEGTADWQPFLVISIEQLYELVNNSKLNK